VSYHRFLEGADYPDIDDATTAAAAQKKDIRMIFGRLTALSAILALAGAVSSPDEEKAARIVDRFDHFETGFALDGAHVQVGCQECHRGGVFRGTPRTCETCHNNIIAEGKPFRHIPTPLQCSSCHTEQDWRLSRFDHAGFDMGCARCHNNFTAPGMTPGHPPTGPVCEDCHTTVHWDLFLPGADRVSRRGN
jgi:hypothetical protein